MAQERLGMRETREILRLKFELGRSDTEVAASVGRARSTISECARRAAVCGLTSWEQISVLSEAELEARLYPPPQGGRARPSESRPLPEFAYVHEEMKRHKRLNITLGLLWEEYKAVSPDGYRYTRFTELYAAWKKKLSISMRQEHRAGERTFVDYCDGLFVTDARTGEQTPTELFVGCLGASSYTYAEASYSQDLASWLLSHARMFEYFEGVSEIVTPDNLKSGIKRPDRYEPDINPSYQDMITHYGTCVIPARVRKPKDKAKVEAAVLVAQRWILARLRNRVFHSLAELNAATRDCLEVMNHKPMRQLKKSRHQLWLELDRPALKALPASRYEFAAWEKSKLGIHYHVKFDDHFYSAPYGLAGKPLWTRATAETIEVFHQGVRVASHLRSYLKNKYTTTSEHMPPKHRAVAEWTPERITRWAEKTGPQARAAVEEIMRSKDHPQQGFNAALGVIRLGDEFGVERLETACAKAMRLGSPSYTTIKTMLRNRMESVELPRLEDAVRREPESENQLSLAVKGNVRGKGYYH
jgi:transposase